MVGKQRDFHAKFMGGPHDGMQSLLRTYSKLPDSVLRFDGKKHVHIYHLVSFRRKIAKYEYKRAERIGDT